MLLYQNLRGLYPARVAKLWRKCESTEPQGLVWSLFQHSMSLTKKNVPRVLPRFVTLLFPPSFSLSFSFIYPSANRSADSEQRVDSIREVEENRGDMLTSNHFRDICRSMPMYNWCCARCLIVGDVLINVCMSVSVFGHWFACSMSIGTLTEHYLCMRRMQFGYFMSYCFEIEPNRKNSIILSRELI